MAISTTAAILGGASIAGSVFGASKAAKAAKQAGQLEYQAAQDSINFQRETRDQVRADNEPFRQIGLSAANALASSFGLPVSMTGNTAARTSVVGSQGMGGYGKGAPNGMARPMPTSTDYASSDTFGGGQPGTISGGSRIMTGGGYGSPAPAEGGADWQAYGAANPDLQTEWARLQSTGEAQSRFGGDPANFYRFHYQTYGQAEGRPLPTMAPAQPEAPAQTGGTAPGYNDPTATGGYSAGPAPAAYVSPVRMTGPALDVSLAAYQRSPGYTFALSEAQKALDNMSSSMGRTLSGQRIKAAQERAIGLANQDYTDWRNYTTGQYNLDRNRSDTIYEADRGFGYGQARDARGDFERDQGRLDNRYDTRNNTLLTMSGFGTSANAANQNAATTFANNAGQATMVGAQARGNAATNAANAWNSGFNNLMTTGAYLWGSGAFGGAKAKA